MLPDIVIPVREGDRNPELRYALRAIAANVPHRQVWIAGHIPPWVVGVGHIPTRQTATKYENSRANWKAAVDHDGVADDFLIFNDDFFAMRKVQRVPPMHRGLLADVEQHFLRRVRAGRYLMGMRQTAGLLADLGIERPLSYELHMPMLLNKARYLEVWEIANRVRYPHSRTLYGNYWQIGGSRVADPKVLTRGSAYPRGLSWLSTMPDSFEHGQVGAYIRSQFPAASPYERAGVRP
ncbi:hypothetical protein [Streptomyces sp. NPDC007346]|uniref:hypothetical protein n=1 Tax=Streptomyces sp. NPDC007346 TaxID=3154682 RepID=UPI003452594B